MQVRLGSYEGTQGKATFLAIAYGILVCSLDIHNDVPQFPAAAVMGAAFILGFVSPRLILRWAGILSISLVLENLLRLVPWAMFMGKWHHLQVVAKVLGASNPYAPSPISALVSFAPALAAAYLGRRARELTVTRESPGR